MSFKDKISDLIDRKVEGGMDRVAAIAETAEAVDLTASELASLIAEPRPVATPRPPPPNPYANRDPRILEGYRDKRPPGEITLTPEQDRYLKNICGT